MRGQMRLKLYTYHRNSAGQRVRIVLNLKGLSYDYVSTPSLPPGEYLRMNPQGLMPALEIDGRIVAQSMAIIELLEELYPEPPALPRDPIARAEVRAFASAICADMHPLNNQRVRRFMEREFGLGEPAILRWYRHWIARGFDGLEAILARNPPLPFCFGVTPGLADACLVPQLYNARRFDCDLSAYPRLLAIENACRELPAFRRAEPPNQPDFPSESRI